MIHCKKYVIFCILLSVNPVFFKKNEYIDKYTNKITKIDCEFTFNVK